MNASQDNILLFMERFLEKYAIQTGCDFVFEGNRLEPGDVASTRGMLPLLINMAHIQASGAKNILSPDTYHFLYGWLDTLDTVYDPGTLTGKRIDCKEQYDTDICRYTIGAALVLAIHFALQCSDEPRTLHFDMFKEENLYAGEGIQPV